MALSASPLGSAYRSHKGNTMPEETAKRSACVRRVPWPRRCSPNRVGRLDHRLSERILTVNEKVGTHFRHRGRAQRFAGHFRAAWKSGQNIPKNRCRTTIAERMMETIAERMMETLAELPFIGDQVVCLSHERGSTLTRSLRC